MEPGNGRRASPPFCVLSARWPETASTVPKLHYVQQADREHGLVVRAEFGRSGWYAGVAGAGAGADNCRVSADERPASGETSAFEVRLLGPVQVARSGCEIRLGGPRPRAV